MRIALVALLMTLPLGCGHKSSTPNDPGNPADPNGGMDLDGGVPDGYFAPSSLQVSGHVSDFETSMALTSPATMATAALVPPPNVSTMGANFVLDAVPPFSTFFLLAGSPPDHVLTYNAPTTVKDQPLTDVVAYSVSTTYLAKLRTAFNITAQAGTSTVFVRAVDAMGNAAAGIAGSALKLSTMGQKGPFYLDANLQPTANATATSASGWLVYFNVPAGTLKIGSGMGYTVTASDTPTAADDVSLAVATVVQGTSMPGTTTVSFQHDVVPIFTNRGCYNCHSGNGDGRRLGDLVLDGAPMKIYNALTVDISPNFHTTRVNLGDPPKSLVLTMPSYENPPDAHPTVVFTSNTDPDYVKILTWIQQGAKYN